MPQVEIRMTMAFKNDVGPVFYCWLPMYDGNEIVIEKGNIKVILSFPIETSWWAGHDTEEEIKKTINVTAHRIRVSAIINNAEQNFIDYICLSLSERDSAKNDIFAERLKKIAIDIHELVINSLNRLISHIRSRKNQWWIEEFEYKPGEFGTFFVKNRAEIYLNDVKVARFVPGAQVIYIVKSSDDDHIRQDEWDDIKSHVIAGHRAPLIGMIIANAYELAAKGHRRSALLEAVVALEVAIGNYADRLASHPLPEGMTDRVEATSVKSLIDKAGLRGSFGIVLPIMLSEDQLPIDVIRICREAIEARNNVIHNGKRDVAENQLTGWLAAVSECCKRLQILRHEEGVSVGAANTVFRPPLTSPSITTKTQPNDYTQEP